MMARMAGRNPHARSRDMVISMAVLVVPILLIVGFFTWPADRSENIQPVDVRGNLTRAKSESPYPLLHADPLPEGWTPVRVGWAKQGDTWLDHEPATSNWWLVGYLSPKEIYFGVQQRDGVVPGFVERVTREGKAMGEPTAIDGREWTRYESEDGRTRSLVSDADGVVSIVTADTDFAALEEFTAGLRTAK